MKNNNMIVIILIIFIAAVFLYLGYIFFFPKNFSLSQSQHPIDLTKQFSSILQKNVYTDQIKPVKMEFNLFSPLVIKLNQNSFIELLNMNQSSVINPNVFWVSGANGNDFEMATLSINGKIVTFNVRNADSTVELDGKSYLITYSNPIMEGAVLMDLSTGKLYVVNSRGMVLN
jgi:hypothetical protein|uniref:Uncharacterized protein n=1 Tax=Mesoaciditoga lauensis TaxID=1495039 RepID=A0A7V3REY6_9BACT